MALWDRPDRPGKDNVIRRSTPSALIDVVFCRAVGPNNQPHPNLLLALFQHRDSRIWQATIEQVETKPEELRGEYLVRLTTDGIPPIVFVASAMTPAKHAVTRFANLLLPAYNMLTLAAKPTLSHPQPGVVVELTIHVPGCEPQVRTGRYDEHTITVFPTVEDVLDRLSEAVASLPNVRCGIETTETLLMLQLAYRDRNIRRIALERRTPLVPTPAGPTDSQDEHGRHLRSIQF